MRREVSNDFRPLGLRDDDVVCGVIGMGTTREALREGVGDATGEAVRLDIGNMAVAD